jgi:hypothetical protein
MGMNFTASDSERLMLARLRADECSALAATAQSVAARMFYIRLRASWMRIARNLEFRAIENSVDLRGIRGR